MLFQSSFISINLSDRLESVVPRLGSVLDAATSEPKSSDDESDDDEIRNGF